MKFTKRSLILSLCIGVLSNGIVYADSSSSSLNSSFIKDGENVISNEHIEQYLANRDKYIARTHKVIAREGGYKNMGECLFGYNNDNKDEIKNYIEEDDLYRHIMFEIDSIRAQYKDKDYEKEGGWAAIGANPSFYSKDNKKIDVDRYHEGELRTPIDEQKDFTNTFRTIGLYIRNYVYYLSYMTLFKNGKDLKEKDADILKHYVQRIIDDDDTYETAYTKKYLFDRIGEILSYGTFSRDNSILNPEDVKKLEELAEGIKNKHEPLDEGTSAPIGKDYNDENQLNSINKDIENNIDNSYFKIIDFPQDKTKQLITKKDEGYQGYLCVFSEEGILTMNSLINQLIKNNNNITRIEFNEKLNVEFDKDFSGVSVTKVIKGVQDKLLSDRLDELSKNNDKYSLSNFGINELFSLDFSELYGIGGQPTNKENAAKDIACNVTRLVREKLTKDPNTKWKYLATLVLLRSGVNVQLISDIEDDDDRLDNRIYTQVTTEKIDENEDNPDEKKLLELVHKIISDDPKEEYDARQLMLYQGLGKYLGFNFNVAVGLDTPNNNVFPFCDFFEFMLEPANKDSAAIFYEPILNFVQRFNISDSDLLKNRLSENKTEENKNVIEDLIEDMNVMEEISQADKSYHPVIDLSNPAFDFDRLVNEVNDKVKVFSLGQRNGIEGNKDHKAISRYELTREYFVKFDAPKKEILGNLERSTREKVFDNENLIINKTASEEIQANKASKKLSDNLIEEKLGSLEFKGTSEGKHATPKVFDEKNLIINKTVSKEIQANKALKEFSDALIMKLTGRAPVAPELRYNPNGSSLQEKIMTYEKFMDKSKPLAEWLRLHTNAFDNKIVFVFEKTAGGVFAKQTFFSVPIDGVNLNGKVDILNEFNKVLCEILKSEPDEDVSKEKISSVSEDNEEDEDDEYNEEPDTLKTVSLETLSEQLDVDFYTVIDKSLKKLKDGKIKLTDGSTTNLKQLLLQQGGRPTDVYMVKKGSLKNLLEHKLIVAEPERLAKKK